MKLADVKSGGEYTYLTCNDETMRVNLRAYGFFEGVDVVVISRGKYGYVVEVLGGRFSINQKLAEAIILKEKSRGK